MAYKINGKFVSKAVYDEYMASQQTEQNNNKEANTMLSEQEKINMGKDDAAFYNKVLATINPDSEILDSEIPMTIPHYIDMRTPDPEKLERLNKLDESIHATTETENAVLPEITEMEEYNPSNDAELQEDSISLLQEDEKKFLNGDIVWIPEIVTIKELKQRAQAGKLNSATAYQRKPFSGKWGKAEAQDLLHDSVMRGWFIQTFIHQDTETDICDVQDSLQRMSVILSLINNQYTPTTFHKCHDGAYEYLNNRAFCLWPVEDQERYLNQRILIIHNHKDTPAEDTNEMFVRWNKGGVPLSKTQAKRGKYAHKLAALIEAIKNPVWKLKYTNKDNENLPIHGRLAEAGIEDIIIKVLNTCYAATIDHDGDKVSDWFTTFDMHTKPHVAHAVEMVNAYHNIQKVVMKQDNGATMARRIAKSTVIIPLLPLLSAKTDYTNAAMGLYKLFSSDKTSSILIEWKKAASGSTASAESINKRMEILRKVITNA